MRLKELRGLPVIDPTAARKIGNVVDYQIDPVAGRLAALDIDGGESEPNGRVLAQRIRRVGSSAVILTARGGAMPGASADLNERWLDSSTLADLEVMGDDGNLIGHVVDATFDQDSLEIDAYLLNATPFERLFGQGGRILPSKVHSCSRQLMIISTGRVKETDVANEESPSADAQTPLKPADRASLEHTDPLPAPTFEPEADGQPVGPRKR
jgi:sporulation protein YlmC with PRC-barrel domain